MAQIVVLLGHGGLLEATDAKGRMAAALLPKPVVLKLLERVRSEAAPASVTGSSSAAAPPSEEPSAGT